MKFAIIGAGNGGQAMAAHLTLMGHQTVLFGRSKEKLEKIMANGSISLHNALEGKAIVKTTSEIAEAVEQAEYILIATSAQGHKAIAQQLKPLLSPGQVVLIFPGYWGSLEFAQELSDIIKTKDITLGEADSMIYTCRAYEPGVVTVKSVKKSISIGCIPSSKAVEIVSKLKRVFPQLHPAGNVLETTLNNFNPVLHTPVTLFNAARIDRGEDFKFYSEGASPRCVEFMEGLDKERLEVGRALKVKMTSLSDLLRKYYETQGDNIYEHIHSNKAYQAEKAPTSLEYRYLTEEVPFGLVPLSYLGSKLGIKTPHVDAIINMACLLLNRDFWAEGVKPELETIRYWC